MVDRGWAIVCGVLLIVGLFNLGLVLSVLRSRDRRRPFLSGSLSEMLNPWQKEEDALDRLHEEVTRLSLDQHQEIDDANRR